MIAAAAAIGERKRKRRTFVTTTHQHIHIDKYIDLKRNTKISTIAQRIHMLAVHTSTQTYTNLIGLKWQDVLVRTEDVSRMHKQNAHISLQQLHVIRV